VTDPDPKALDELFNRVLRSEDDALVAAREAGAAAGMPAIEVSAQHGKLLFLLASATRATRALEIGTLAGYSTIELAADPRATAGIPRRWASSTMSHTSRKYGAKPRFSMTSNSRVSRVSTSGRSGR